MSTRRFIFLELLLIGFFILVILSAGEVWTVVKSSYQRYLFFLGGMVLIFVVDKFTYRNNQMLKTFHHESTHLLVNLITFRKVLMLRVDTRGGVVSSVGNKWMMEAVSLAPYCLPLGAYVVMLFGCFFANDMSHIYAIILGAAYGFHLLCIKADMVSLGVMGRHQPDINQYPLVFSYLYILSFWLFNTMIVLLSVRRDMFEAYRFMLENFKEIIF